MAKFEIDLDSLEQAVRRDRDLDYFGLRRMTIRALASLGSAVCFFSVLLPLVNGSPIYEPDHRTSFWIRIGMGMVLGTIAEVLNYRREIAWRKDPRAAAERIKRDFDEATGPDWVRITVKRGLTLGLSAGIPIGLLMLFFPAPDHSTVQDRLPDTLKFELFTFAWAVPLMFVLRWVSLKSTARFVRGANAVNSHNDHVSPYETN